MIPTQIQTDKSTSSSQMPGQLTEIVWFGHSLLLRGATNGHPKLDIPQTVSEIFYSDRKTRSKASTLLRPVTFAEGPFGYDYWLSGSGNAQNKLKTLEEHKIQYIVGIGFMHLLSKYSYQFPNLTYWMRNWMSRSYRSPRELTKYKYQFIYLAKNLHPEASWVNYIGPAFSHATDNQSAINKRFECIKSVANSVGVKVINVPVGPAFRFAETMAMERPHLTIQLQQEDKLHLTAQGGLLAALVFYRTLYGFNTPELEVPPSYQDVFGSGMGNETAKFLKQIANQVVKEYRPEPCSESDLLPEDKSGRKLLESLGNLSISVS